MRRVMKNFGKILNTRSAVWFIALFLILGTFTGFGAGKVKAAGNPTISYAMTQDENGNGKIDEIFFSFNQAMDTSVTSTTGFSVAGYTIGATGTWSGAGDFAVTVVEGSSYDTGATPAFSYDAVTGHMKDASANILNTITSGSIPIADGAEPRLMTAVAVAANSQIGIQAGDQVVLTFSEPIRSDYAISKTTINWALPFLPPSISHSWLDGSGNIGLATWSSNNTVLTVVFSATSGAPTIVVGDQIAPSYCDDNNLYGCMLL